MSVSVEVLLSIYLFIFIFFVFSLFSFLEKKSIYCGKEYSLGFILHPSVVPREKVEFFIFTHQSTYKYRQKTIVIGSSFISFIRRIPF